MTLDHAVSGFLEHKRALARKYISEEAELRLLVRFASQRGVERLEQLTPAVLDRVGLRDSGGVRQHGGDFDEAGDSTGGSRNDCRLGGRCRQVLEPGRGLGRN